ncbi:hypothetical protein CC78DRAFT_466374 [Lojkania enalia]|uniref:Genetic interactor of prohibitins 3, mitochondrial n=1 Tax=Lojkania enalia TaxID=147567 RepID=A0A9P4K6T2_9PLEO|nr:hypothetical protein CC78DRAFT_466374 [Didymosphaeria enalia]
MRPAPRLVTKLVRPEAALLTPSVPVFLCPALLRAPTLSPVRRARQVQVSHSFSTIGRIRQQAAVPADATDSIDTSPPNLESLPSVPVRQLPRCCPGCGAHSQVVDKNEAGYYNIDRRQVKAYLDLAPAAIEGVNRESTLYKEALKQADPMLLEEIGIDPRTLDASNPDESMAEPETPICDRCHNLIHHRVGTPIYHPSVDAIQQTIAESPHRRNHIYHVLDAADFPLSIIPNLQSRLRLPTLRTQNRRARHKGWISGNRIAEVSFIITRADLLAPLKEQVDNLMPYMQNVLRDALGRANRNARLGNVYLVSAKRGWWTKKVKEDIWDRGGAGWMVGKVNVGKSNLFEVVFPKGRGPGYEAMENVKKRARQEPSKTVPQPEDQQPGEEEDYDPDSLLPPSQPYVAYPVLPITSSLPGTTASPIRIPFGGNRGELIDLPGLARTNPDITTFVKPAEHDQLVMKSRVTAHRHVLKPTQSLVLGGGLIRITPVTPDLVFLVHPFVPLTPHITHTEKAMGLQTQTRESGVHSVLVDGVGHKMKSAGIFKLKWDATKKLAGPLTSSMAGKMKPENLPFKIWSADILIEGVGWVEVSCQARKPRGWRPIGMNKKDPNHAKIDKERKMEELTRERERERERKRMEGGPLDRAGLNMSEKESIFEDEMEAVPEIEVFSPLGKYIGIRQPMCGSVLGGPRYVPSRERKARPRRSMVAVKRQRRPQAAS